MNKEVAEAVQAEREACAQLAEQLSGDDYGGSSYETAHVIARRIRGRGDLKPAESKYEMTWQPKSNASTD